MEESTATATTEESSNSFAMIEHKAIQDLNMLAPMWRERLDNLSAKGIRRVLVKLLLDPFAPTAQFQSKEEAEVAQLTDYLFQCKLILLQKLIRESDSKKEKEDTNVNS